MGQKRLALIISSFFMLTHCVTAPGRMEPGGSEDPKKTSFTDQLKQLRGKGPRKRVLLLPFINESIEKSPAVTKAARDAFVRGLRYTDSFVIVDNQDVSKDLSLYVKNGEYDMNEVGRIAADMGVAAIIEGRVMDVKAKKVGDEVGLFRSLKAQVVSTVSIRVFSASTKREVLNDIRSATVESSTTRVAKYSRDDRNLSQDPELIRECLQKAFLGSVLPVMKAVDKLNWDGKIAAVSGDRIYVNAGRLTGINVGDILKVTDSGEEVFDPDTGALIGKAPGRMKGTLEVVSYFGKDGAVAIVHSGSGFKENDIVELY